MLEQALAKVMNLGLNWRQVTGPVCFPSRSATFIPLSAFHTWIFPSSDPENPYDEETGITLCKLISSPFSIRWGALVKTYRSWWTESLVWKKPPEWHLYCCYSPAVRKRDTLHETLKHKLGKTQFKTKQFSHPERVENGSFESIQHSERSSIGGDQNELSVIAELETRPLACSFIL